MRLVVVSIGRLKQGPERELAERYRERFDDIGRKLGFRGLDIHEIPESRARDAGHPDCRGSQRRFQRRSPKNPFWWRSMSAATISTVRPLPGILAAGAMSRPVSTIFAIGGADGLSPDLRRKAKLRIAFGSATWPHQMVRVMLLEQIYRAATILAGHPYHRA